MDPILSALDRQFTALEARGRELLARISDEQLYLKPRPVETSMAAFSCGEYILRSAAMVEQAFGGITTRLWDDPFEWTLPEKLATRAAIGQYLDEVEATRQRGFASIGHDAALFTLIPAPETMRSLLDVLLGTLNSAAHYQGRAFALFQVISDEKLPRL